MSLNNLRYILLQSLSSIFAKNQSSNNYKVLSSIANELYEVEQQISQIELASTVQTALSGDLDLHGKTFEIQRDYLEDDESYRQRLLASYNRSNVTYNNLKNLTSDYSLGEVTGYQYIYDRWWVGGKILPDKVTENLVTITDTISQTSSGIFINTIPECWLITDTTRTGTNYCSGCSFENNASGALITLTTPVSAGTQMSFAYTPNVTTSGDYSYDLIPHSFINYDTLMRHKLLTNNFVITNSDKESITIRTDMNENYPVNISYYDADLGTIYRWQTVIDANQSFTINENKRIDNLIIDEYSYSDSLLQVTTQFEIGNVVGVYLSSDTSKTDTNYATTNNFTGKTIILDTSLPIRTGVITTYNKYHISDYLDLNIDNIIGAGEDDLRFTVQFDIWQTFIKYGTFKYGEKRWGELSDPSAILIGELLDIAKAAGIKINILLTTTEVKYGLRHSIYAEVIYSGDYI